MGLAASANVAEVDIWAPLEAPRYYLIPTSRASRPKTSLSPVALLSASATIITTIDFFLAFIPPNMAKKDDGFVSVNVSDFQRTRDSV